MYQWHMQIYYDCSKLYCVIPPLRAHGISSIHTENRVIVRYRDVVVTGTYS